MKVIAFDPGYGRLGVAVIQKKEGEREELIFSECFETSGKEELNQRLYQLGDHVREIISKYQPDACAIEGLFFSKNTKTALAVSEARGVLLFQVSDAAIPIYEFTPNQVKLAVTGYGHAQKNDVYTMVTRLITIGDTKQDDEIDAIAVGLCFFASYASLRKNL